MAEKERFYLVWNIDQHSPVETFSKDSDANAFARNHAAENIGDTIVVFEPGNAYRAEARAAQVYLGWPKQEPAPEMPSPGLPEFPCEPIAEAAPKDIEF